MSRQSALREHIQRSHLQIYLQEINATALLSAAEERELAERVAEGDPEARDHMVKANLRLVVNIARNYLGKGLCLEDLIEEGNLGLLRAVEGFDGSMDTRFSTYASFWIKQSIRRAVMNNGKPIRLGRMPTDDEVGKALHLSKQKLGIVTKAIQVHNLTPHPESPEPDNPILDDVLTDDRSKTAEEMLFEADDLERILDRLERLDDRVTTVVRMRFGLPPYQPMTLREVGERLGLTRERVRQLEHQAIQDLVEAFTEELV
jgi:RNA polymerase primary sigma factor